MALKKRKKGKEFSVDEMLIIANEEFVRTGSIAGNIDGVFVLSVTCFKDPEKKYVVSDSREDYSNDDGTKMLPSFYGKTLREALKKAIKFRLNIIDE